MNNNVENLGNFFFGGQWPYFVPGANTALIGA